jgi:hypothetical protein
VGDFAVPAALPAKLCEGPGAYHRPVVPELTPKVRLLLDVDGVLNADTLHPGGFWTEWRVDRAGGLSITWSPTVTRFILALSARGVEVVWLTSWGQRANDPLGPLMGFPEFPVAGEYQIDSGWWKLPLAQNLYRLDPLPFVWVDDELEHELAALEWLKSLPEEQFLIVAPNPWEGIHPRHIRAIAAFVDCVLGRHVVRSDTK